MRAYTPLWSEKWEKQFADEGVIGRQDYLDGLAAQEAIESLQRRLEALTALLTPQAAKTEGVSALIQGAKDDIRAQRQSNEILLRRLPVHWRAPKVPRLADKVFGTPELCELILSMVSVPDLLRLYRVSKAFYNTIEGSLTLQRRLGLQPSPSSHLELPAEHLIYHMEGMDMNEMFYSYNSHILSDRDGEAGPRTMPVKINVCTYSCHSKDKEQIELRPLGERCKKMLITQPPIKTMGVYTQCCTPRYRPYRDRQEDAPLHIVTCETGITTEQIWEVVAKAQEEHRLCPNADPFDHDPQGFVQLRMSIEGSLVLNEDDPALVAKNKGRKESREEDEDFQSRETRFRPYIAAKRSARDNGEPIPTFAEFQARQSAPEVQDA